MMPTPAASGHGPSPVSTGSGRTAHAAAWNLSLNVLSKSQTLALLAAGSIIDGLSGVGVVVSAVAATLLGQALADIGLSSELGRLGLAYPNRATVDRSIRAIAQHAPFALLLAPGVYALLGPTSPSLALLAVIGANSALLVVTIAMTAVLNGLGDFRTPAMYLGSMRSLSGVAAVIAVSIEPTPTVVIGAFAVGEALGLLGLTRSLLRQREQLDPADHPEGRLRRSHVWLGGAFVVNILTNQGDTILVASILSPRDLGLYATASALQNGVTTFASATATPFARRSVRATLDGDDKGGAHAFRRALTIGAAASIVLALLTWVGTQLIGDSVDSLAGLAAAPGPAVLALALAAGPLGVMGNVCFMLGIGFARHRQVGTCQIQVGGLAVAAIVAGARIAGPVGAAAATIVRDAVRLTLAWRVTAPPEFAEPAVIPRAQFESTPGIGAAEP